jgi:hypothetical protein
VGESENVTGHDLVLLGGGTVNEDLEKKSHVNKFVPDSQIFNIPIQIFAIPGAIPHTRRWSTISTIAASLPS